MITLHAFYNIDPRRVALVNEARSWLGTPFRKGVAIKLAGVDCVHLAHSVYLNSGMPLPDLNESYSLDSGRHLNESKIVRWLEASGKFHRIDYETECHDIGDLLLFRIGKVEHHCGVKITGATFINAIKRHGVRELSIDDSTWASRLASVYRPVVTT